MTDNEILARWQGWWIDDGLWHDPKKDWFGCQGKPPDYLNDDAAAMSLLDTLVSKGFRYLCYGESGLIDLLVLQGSVEKVRRIKPTRREAVVAACLELIGKEDV